MKKPDENKKKRTGWKGHFRCCQWVVAYTFILIFVIFVFVNVILPVPSGWERRAKGTLRSLGSMQLAYRSMNDKKVYGSYQALQDTDYVTQGFTLGNYIESYSVTWEVMNISTVPTEDLPSGIISSFTIVAWPERENLGTFAVTEDQVLRYCGHGDDPDNVAAWDPIY